jgi:hypothetical protein
MSWKASFIGGSALLVLVSAAGAADVAPVYKASPRAPEVMPSQASGYVEAYGGWATTKENVTFCGVACEVFTEQFDGSVLGGAGRGNYWFLPNMSVQVDAQAEGTSYRRTQGPFTSHFSTLSYLIGGHANWRNSQMGLIGIFGGGGDAGGGFSSATRHWVIGGEAQLYWNQLTLYVQGGHNSTINELSSFGPDRIHAGFVRGTGRYFLTPGVMVEGTVLYSAGEIDWAPLTTFSNQDFKTRLWQAKIEAQLGAYPFSVFAKYQESRTTYDTLNFFGNGNTVDEKVNDRRFLVGLRLYMGENTLLSNDRRGATLDIIAPLGDPTGPLTVPPSAGGQNAIVLD